MRRKRGTSFQYLPVSETSSGRSAALASACARVASYTRPRSSGSGRSRDFGLSRSAPALACSGRPDSSGSDGQIHSGHRPETVGLQVWFSPKVDVFGRAAHQNRGAENPAFRPGRKRRFTSPEMSVVSLVCSHVQVPAAPHARPGSGAAGPLWPRPVRMEPGCRTARPLAPGRGRAGLPGAVPAATRREPGTRGWPPPPRRCSSRRCETSPRPWPRSSTRATRPGGRRGARPGGMRDSGSSGARPAVGGAARVP